MGSTPSQPFSAKSNDPENLLRAHYESENTSLTTPAGGKNLTANKPLLPAELEVDYTPLATLSRSTRRKGALIAVQPLSFQGPSCTAVEDRGAL